MTPRERAIDWARRIAAEPRAVFVDTETTGLGPEAEICDIAIIGIDGRVLLDSLVFPLNPIPAEASAVHHITDDMLRQANAPRWSELWPRVATILHPGRPTIVYNAGYDLGIINQVNRAAKCPEFPRGWQCAMLAYGEFDGTHSFRGPGFKWHKLSNAAAALGIENPGAHRALADAETTRLLVLAMSRADEEMAEAGQLALFPEMAPATSPARDWTR